jgi:2-aminoadipate transaminase
MEQVLERVSLARRAARLSPVAPVSGHHNVIAFESGHAFPGVLPDMVEAAREALTTYRAETLQYAPKLGLPELREWIAGFMTADGASTSADEVMVVNGAKNGIDLVCRLLLDDGDQIVVTAPTYFTSIPIFRSFGAEFIEVGQDDEGMDVDELKTILDRLKSEGRKLPKFIYNVPDFHNPTGVTMTRRRRQALVELAADNGILIIEDSPYRKVRFEGAAEPPVKALDPANVVILLGTFSKLMAPGLRIGWVVAAKELIARLIQLKADGGTCPLTQRMIVEFCKAGHLDPHIERVQDVYRSHRDRMVEALRQHLPEAETVIPQGGYYLWVRLPAAVDGDVLAKRAGADSVLLLPGSKCFAGRGGGYPNNQGPPKNYVRLAYSHAGPEEIEEGIKRIAKAVRS